MYQVPCRSARVPRVLLDRKQHSWLVVRGLVGRQYSYHTWSLYTGATTQQLYTGTYQMIKCMDVYAYSGRGSYWWVRQAVGYVCDCGKVFGRPLNPLPPTACRASDTTTTTTTTAEPQQRSIGVALAILMLIMLLSAVEHLYLHVCWCCCCCCGNGIAWRPRAPINA